MSCQVIGDTGSISHAAETTGGNFCSNENKNVGGSSDVVSGWMYLNELGQMCGPYISQQLVEGLSSGFLPDELPVYPVMNGALMVAVPLKLFKEYPDHVSTGFTYLSRPTSSASTTIESHSSPMQDIHSGSSYVLPNSNHQGQQTSYSCNMTILDSKLPSSNSLEQQQPLTWENKCWQYLDGSGRPAGPYSLSELYYWHQYGYLPDSVMISHVENKYSACALLPLINACRKDNVPSGTVPGHVSSDRMQLVSNVSEEIGSQLHNGIMKASRRLVLDEIIGNVIVDFIAKKKARKQLKTEQESNGVRRSFLKDEMDKVGAGEGNDRAALTATAACHDVSVPEYSGDNSTQELCSIKNTKSIGGVENFQASKTAVSQMLFDYCRQVLWNAVFYDLVGNCALSWRKSRRWSGSCTEEITASAQQSIPVPMISDATAQVRETDSPDDELDFPPGFQHKLNDYSFSNSLPSCSHSIENNLPSPRTSVCTRSFDDNWEETIARVQEELFLASKASMVDFVRSYVEEEAFKLSDCSKDGQISEVSLEVTEQLCNVTDSGEPASSEMAQGLDSGHISLDDSPLQGVLSSHKPSLNSHKQSSLNFLGSSFQILGAPCSIAAADQAADEPPPPGLAAPGTEPCPQHLQMRFLNEFRTFSRTVRSTQKASLPLYEDGSAGFLGSAFKRLGMPICSSVDDQRTDEPPPGSQSGTSNVVYSGDNKFRQVVLDVSIPKWRKFVILALLRRKLHDDVLREWTSFFHDVLHRQMKQRDPEKILVGSAKLPNVPAALEPEIDVLTERSKSCYTSGPSELSVVEITYSRRKVSKKVPTEVHLQGLQSSKRGKQNITKKLASTAAPGVGEERHSADQLCLKKEESASRTLKAGVSVKRNLIKNGQPVRSSNPRKRQRLAGDSSIAAKDYVKRGVEKAAGAEKNINATDELSACYKGTRKDKLATDCLKLPNTSSEVSKLKRKSLMDETPSLQSKGTKPVKLDVKQAPCKKAGKGRTLTGKSKAMNLCPMSSGCARSSIDGWEWRKWSLNARPGERARVRGIKLPTVHFGSDSNTLNSSHAKGISARTNRVKLRNLLAAAEGAEILKASQLKARKKRLRFQRSKIHDWGLIALEPIEAEDFVIEYIGELIRPRISDIRECEYEKMGIGSSYLFRLDDGYVVDATKRGGIARFINHSCEPNCYTKTVTVDGQKRIFIYAKRHIASGEEITYNYKFPLEEKKIPCNCGAKRCRGSMN
ncbi:histone-lysine N-methyltransferase ATXR7 [Silene latifolia]|uniref:histone-lysine N-methyltransferase ATXR7 n=1 Tax=Silene latifolia TaxID=37657 RepID=UPI003D7867E3